MGAASQCEGGGGGAASQCEGGGGGAASQCEGGGGGAASVRGEEGVQGDISFIVVGNWRPCE